MKFSDPDGRHILKILDFFNMSEPPLGLETVGNSKSIKGKFRDIGCYVTAFANIFASSQYYNAPLENTEKYNTPLKINSEKHLFQKDTGSFKSRQESMNTLFGENKWDYWTKTNQGEIGLSQILSDYKNSNSFYMIVGIFDLSSDTSGVDNHMVGLSGPPDKNGIFHHMTPISRGDYNRLINISESNAYTIQNLKEIRVIFIEE